MLKKLLSTIVVLTMTFSLVGCNGKEEKPTKSANQEQNTHDGNPEEPERPFMESEGAIRHLLIEGEQVAIPETVGEYQRYLSKIGKKVELIANPNNGDNVIAMNDTLEKGAQSSLKAYFKVYMSDNEYHKFGVSYVNDTDKDISVSKAKIKKIILYYDTYVAEDQPEVALIDTIAFVTDNDTFVMDGSTTSKMIMNELGTPEQNTDGYLTYNDPSGFIYRFATSNKPGKLTQFEITYPK